MSRSATMKFLVIHDYELSAFLSLVNCPTFVVASNCQPAIVGLTNQSSSLHLTEIVSSLVQFGFTWIIDCTDGRGGKLVAVMLTMLSEAMVQ